MNPTIEHNYSLLETLASTRPRYLLATESMKDHKQHTDNIKIYNSAHQLNIVPILFGSQQTQHVEFHKDDPDHLGQLTRSKHEAHGRGDNHLATAMDP
jgi:hypothetical protein